LEKSQDDFKNTPYDANNYDTKSYGEKFFVVYVSSNCTNCESIQPGFATLQDGWGTSFVNTDGRAFKMYTIYSDETSSNDDQDVNKYTAFQRYLNNYQEFYELAGSRLAEDTPYRYNASLTIEHRLHLSPERRHHELQDSDHSSGRLQQRSL
jgi:hypothetical protein